MLPSQLRTLLCLFALILGLTALTPDKAYAQFGSDFTTFDLVQSSQEFNISRFVYVTEDKDGSLLWSEVLKRHVSNIRGERVKSDSINLSFNPNPQYLVFSLHNKTQNKEWVLNLGQRSTGRTGLLDEFYFYNASKKIMIADTVSKNADILSLEKNVIGPAIPFTLAPGETALFLLYLRVDNGLPFTLPLRVSSQKTLSHSLLDSKATHNIVQIFCIIGIGFYFGIFFLRQRWEYLLFGTYFLILLSIYGRLNSHFFSFHEADNLIFGALLNIGAFVAVWMNITFFNYKKYNEKTTQSISVIISILALLCIPVLMFLTPVGHVSRPIFFIGIPFLIVLFAAVTAFMRAFKGRSGALFLTIGWLSFGLGILTSHLAYFDFVEPSQISHIGTWISLVPQCLFFIAASSVKFRSLESKTSENKTKNSTEAESLVRIQRSKEAADQQRLLRVIEREREVMEELREREALRTEEMRKAKEQADEANRAKSAFLAIVSHEIRTPMTGILGMVKLMMKTQLTRDQSNYAMTIQESGETMLALLNDILDFEKIESGKMDIEAVDFDLKRLINSVVTLMSGHAREKAITLKSEINGVIPNFVTGDPTRIRQVLLNLVGNAIKFTDRGGVTLIVRAHKIEVDDKDPSNPTRYEVYFGVKDTGIGISEEGQKNLFNPFSQADSSISRKFGGTGLGLAICKALISAMGSQIKLTSKAGEGSTFSFTINLPEASSDKTTVEASTPMTAEQKTSQKEYAILLCEDNEINQKVVIGFLEQRNHQIDIANDGIEAVTKATGETKYDLILMDIEMPGQNGLEASVQIREIGGVNAETPIVALSGNVSKQDKQKCFNNGMNDHLEKPVNPDALERMINTIETGDFAHPDIVVLEDKDPATPAPEPQTETPQEKPAQPEEAAKPDEEDSFATSIEQHEKEDENESEKPVFDKAMLQTLKDSLPADQIKELLDGLFVKADEIFEDLEKAAEKKDFKEIIARAHELKGMTGNFGLSKLSAQAAAIEKLAREEEDADYVTLSKELVKSNKEAKEAIDNWS